MCGRFYTDRRVLSEIASIADISLLTGEKGAVIGHSSNETCDSDSIRDICPSDTSVIIRSEGCRLIAQEMRWGYPVSGKLLINARAESAYEKKLFSDSVRLRRCIIPARGFYEWDKNKVKYTFSQEKDHILFMAGLYDIFGNALRFTILTTAANETMSPVHDRMPLIFPENFAETWIREDAGTWELLSYRPQALIRSTEYEQLTLNDWLGI